MKNNVFISYNHSNESTELVREISTKLKNMGLRVWFDQQEISPQKNKTRHPSINCLVGLLEYLTGPETTGG